MSKNAASGTATNNDLSFYSLKINNRLKSLPNKNEINVLECFAGEGKLWDSVQRLTDKKINRYRIDINNYDNIDYEGDSLKYLTLSKLKYDIIDLDSWGSPIKHLEVLFKKNYIGVVHCTYCSPISFNPDKILAKSYYNFDWDVIKNCPSLFCKEIDKMILKYLNDNKIIRVNGYLSNQKNYFWFVV